MDDTNAASRYPAGLLSAWDPQLPAGRIDRLYLHWSAGNYQDVFPAYHFCVATDADGNVVVCQTNDIESNMRDVRRDPQAPYAAHTRGRNSFALGLSIMAMKDATPHDFGDYPLTDAILEGLCVVSARLARFYAIPIDEEHVLTHAEAALSEGYFGRGQHQRWDIARLAPASQPLETGEAGNVGSWLRSRIQMH